MKHFFTLFVCIFTLVSCRETKHIAQNQKAGTMMIRIAEIEINPAYLQEYLAILKTEAAASVKKEAGVISIFPMYKKEEPAQIRILEIYADRSAYEAHLKTPHFLEYKTSTLHMVKKLNLVEMNAIDSVAMQAIFSKLKKG